MSIFPTTDTTVDDSSTFTDNGTFLSFNYDDNEFNLVNGEPTLLTGDEAVKAWISKALKTEKDRFVIYDDIDYGVEVEDLIIGSALPTGTIKSEVKREIIATLTQHDSIESVTDFSFSTSSSLLTVSFTVNLSDDTTIETEVSY
jgi:hypothetical protein